jgi:SAM-dependent methyltransferase
MLKETLTRLALPVLRHRWVQPVWHRYREWSFDRARHIRTAGFAELDEIGVGTADTRDSNRYEGVPPRSFGTVLDLIQADFSRLTFIDFGCGKGRALFLAAEAGFRRVVGVEFGHALAEAAKANLQSYRSRRQRCFQLSVVEGDATQYDVPAEPLLCFLFNPFKRPVADQVMARLERSLRSNPREAYVVWLFGDEPGVLDHHAFLTKLAESTQSHRRYCIYRSNIT